MMYGVGGESEEEERGMSLLASCARSPACRYSPADAQSLTVSSLLCVLCPPNACACPCACGCALSRLCVRACLQLMLIRELEQRADGARAAACHHEKHEPHFYLGPFLPPSLWMLRSYPYLHSRLPCGDYCLRVLMFPFRAPVLWSRASSEGSGFSQEKFARENWSQRGCDRKGDPGLSGGTHSAVISAGRSDQQLRGLSWALRGGGGAIDIQRRRHAKFIRWAFVSSRCA